MLQENKPKHLPKHNWVLLNLGMLPRYQDTITVKFPIKRAEATKRGIVGKVASVYDLLGLVFPMTLRGKLLYRDACQLKIVG